MVSADKTGVAGKRFGGADTRAAYLLSLEIENVRCFGPKQVLDLSDGNGRPARWTVILGDNGVGKTTLLQSLVSLEPRRHFYRPNAPVDRPQVELVTNGQGWNVYRDPQHPESTKIRGCIAVGPELSATHGGYEAVELTVPTSTASADNRASQLPQGHPATRLACCAYGATRRMGMGKFSDDGASDPAASLFSDSASLIDAEDWLLSTDYMGRLGSKQHHRLDRVRKILIELLPDTLDLKVQEDKQFQSSRSRPVVKARTPYGWVPLSELSLGYRTMISWTVDLASRLAEVYPQSSDPLAEPAVVLVDEVDLHLHPKWQRELMRHLTTKFPNTQFVVTAHSPLVVLASEQENLVLVRRQGGCAVIDNDVEHIRGWRLDQVVTSDLFGVASARPPAYDELLAQRNQLLAKKKFDAQDKALLKQLEARIAELPAGENSTDMRAMEIIRQAAEKLRRERAAQR